MRRASGGLLLALVACNPSAPPGTPVERVTIPAGASFAAITDSLVTRGIIGSPRWFRFVARVRGSDRKVQSGIYDLPRPAPASQVLDLLTSGGGVLTRLTIPEGLTVAEVAVLAQEQLAIPAESILAAARDTALLREFAVDAPSFEGFLRPETYFVPLTITGRALVREMATAFRADWDTAWDRRAAELGLTRTEFVALASIVEGEARVADERPVIAAVYLNRLRIGMPLQADPTVQYAIQLQTGARKDRLFLRDYEIDSPWNTYRIPGLPPGPVGLPGRESLRAVAFPADVPFLFFVAGDSGRHVFTRSYPEHLRAIRRVRGR